jgi:hypothetical protein
MPAGNKTGPTGAGPQTGRAAGYCAGYPTPGYANPPHAGYGRGYGRGYHRGHRRGFCRNWYTIPPTPINPQAAPITQPLPPEQEVTALENYQKNLTAEKADLEQEIEGVRARIEELKAKQANP